MQRRRVLLAWSIVVAALAGSSFGWVIGAVIIGAYMTIAPGSAACALLMAPGDLDWITVIGSSFAIDAVGTEIMVYAHVWTPLRGVIALAVFTAALAGVDELRSRS